METGPKRVPVLLAAAALASQAPSTSHGEPAHTEGRTQYRAPRAAVVPTIDGVADELAWQSAAWQELSHRWLGPEYSPDDFQGRYKVVWAPEKIYLLAEIVDDILIDSHRERDFTDPAHRDSLAALRRLRGEVIRSGNANERPIDRRRLAIWISPRDLVQLVRIGLEHPDVRCETVYGVSGNDRSWYDNANAVRLGYRPQDNAETYAAEVLAADPAPGADAVAEAYQGGTFCAQEFSRKT